MNVDGGSSPDHACWPGGSGHGQQQQQGGLLHSPPPPPPLPVSSTATDMMHPAESDDDEDLKLDEAEGKRLDDVANHLQPGGHLDGTESARMGLQVMMRKKKQKLVSGLSCSVTPLAASSGSNCELDRERPMSWEWELSDEDCLSRGMEEMSPSPLPGRFASFDPGSPMSTNDSDKEDGGSLMSPRKCAVDFSQKIFGAPSVPSQATTVTSVADAANSGMGNMENNLSPVTSGGATNGSHHHHHPQQHQPQPPFFTPTQSPLAPRHTNNAHSYSSSSSPEQIKRLFYSPTQSPLQSRHLLAPVKLEPPPPYSSPSPSPSQTRHATTASSSALKDTAAAAVASSSSQSAAPFSPSQSPGQQSRHHHHLAHHSSSGGGGGRESPYGSPYSSVGSPGGSVRYSSSPNQSPSQGRHSVLVTGAGSFVGGGGAGGGGAALAAAAASSSSAPDPLPMFSSPSHTPVALLMGGSDDQSDTLSPDFGELDDKSGLNAELLQHASLTGQTGISRQQLINSPCPICGDRISGFHYGIFSCESCKGFFKRTVQNKKNYVCLRGASCPISTTTRKKCPACRFDKCLKRGMKLEAIREDRTRGGRSTYQCTYALPPSLASSSGGEGGGSYGLERIKGGSGDRSGDESDPMVNGSGAESTSSKASSHGSSHECSVPNLIQEIMSVEHLWYYSETEVSKLPESVPHVVKPFDASSNSDFFGNLCNIADHRLYKIVKWCKSLPLFRNVSIDDQICLLLNSWCQLLLLSCCYRSIPTPEEIRVSLGKSVSLGQARALGLGPIIERMLNLTDHLRRLRVDQHEYVCLKVIILLTSDVGGLKEPEKVRHAQERVIQALQTYTMTRYADHPSKFGELLLRIPELERTCQIGKDSLSMKHREGEVPSFNLLVELLRGEH